MRSRDVTGCANGAIVSTHADKILAAVETDDGTSALTASWRRCMRVYRLDPDGDKAPRTDLVALRDGCARNATLLDIAASSLDQLFRMLSDDSSTFLTDCRGMLLDFRTNRACDTWERRPRDWYGTFYSEDQIGTSSIGTCLTEQRAVTIRGGDHFMTRYTDRASIASPLFGPDGNLAGTLSLNQNAGAHDARLDPFLSIAVANFARRIEAEMFARAYPTTRLILASTKGQASEALLAVDHDDRVVGATRGARRLLALHDDAIAGAPNIDEVLDTSRRNRGEILAEAERRAIVRALSRVGGNLSAAARAIGISRSTLYRKLAAYRIAPPPCRHE